MFGNQFQGIVEVNEVYLSGNELTQYLKDRKALNADKFNRSRWEFSEMRSK